MIKNYESSLKQIIKEYNLKPKKKLGQNFLVSEKEFFSMGQRERAPGNLVINLSLRMTKGRGVNGDKNA